MLYAAVSRYFSEGSISPRESGPPELPPPSQIFSYTEWSQVPLDVSAGSTIIVEEIGQPIITIKVIDSVNFLGLSSSSDEEEIEDLTKPSSLITKTQELSIQPELPPSEALPEGFHPSSEDDVPLNVLFAPIRKRRRMVSAVFASPPEVLEDSILPGLIENLVHETVIPLESLPSRVGMLEEAMVAAEEEEVVLPDSTGNIVKEIAHFPEQPHMETIAPEKDMPITGEGELILGSSSPLDLLLAAISAVSSSNCSSSSHMPSFVITDTSTDGHNLLEAVYATFGLGLSQLQSFQTWFKEFYPSSQQQQERYQEELQKIADEHTSEIKNIRENHLSTLQRIRSDHALELQQIKGKHVEEKDKLKKHNIQLLGTLSSSIVEQQQGWFKEREELQSRVRDLTEQLDKATLQLSEQEAEIQECAGLRDRQIDLFESLEMITTDRDQLLDIIMEDAEQIQLLKYQIDNIEWDSKYKDGEIFFLKNLRLQHIQELEQEQDKLKQNLTDVCSNLEELQQHKKNYDPKLEQCFTRLQRLREDYTHLSTQIQDRAAECSFHLNLLGKHIQNLSEINLQQAQKLEKITQELHKVQQSCGR